MHCYVKPGINVLSIWIQGLPCVVCYRRFILKTKSELMHPLLHNFRSTCIAWPIWLTWRTTNNLFNCLENNALRNFSDGNHLSWWTLYMRLLNFNVVASVEVAVTGVLNVSSRYRFVMTDINIRWKNCQMQWGPSRLTFGFAYVV